MSNSKEPLRIGVIKGELLNRILGVVPISSVSKSRVALGSLPLKLTVLDLRTNGNAELDTVNSSSLLTSSIEKLVRELDPRLSSST